MIRPLIFAAALAAVPGYAACTDAERAQAQAAGQSNDLPAMEASFTKLQHCNDVELGQWLGRRIAGLLYNRATAANPPDERLLRRALDYGRPWQILATLGDIHHGRKEYGEASRRYQEALTEIESASATPTAPPDAMILAIRKKAEQAGLLSNEYVPTTRTRDNRNAGLGAISVRGVSITAVALPIEFKFKETALTPKGEAALRDMIELLNNERPTPSDLIIEGHADRVGSAQANLILSQQRAQVIVNQLRAGLKADRKSIKITPVGYGNTRPYKADDPTAYSQDQRDQMDRRGELKRGRAN